MIDNAEKICRSPEWLPHRYDDRADVFRFVHVPRAKHRGATFLTDEYLDGTDRFVVIGREHAQTLVRPGRIHFLFHSAYCCSTMIARALDIPGTSMGLKEPVVLNDLVGWRRRGANPAKLAETLKVATNLLARPFGVDKTVIVKPSNIVNILAIPLLAQRPDSSALLLYAPLRRYLGSIARKDMWGRIWVRELLVGLAKDRMLLPGFGVEELLRLTDLQVAAIGWLSEHALFSRISQRYAGGRVKFLDSETWLNRTPAALRALSVHFELGLTERQMAKVMTGPAFTTNSKDGSAFQAIDREQDQLHAQERHAEEIKMVAHWASEVAKSHHIDMDPQPQLLS